MVEDNPADARLLKEMLGDAGAAFDLTNAERLTEALRRLNGEAFDCILLDLMLPDSRGLETFFRVYARASHVPIVVLSGLSDENLAATAVREGAQDYLVKGHVDGGLLLRSVRYAIERRRQKTEKLSQKERPDRQGGEPNYLKTIGASQKFKEVMDVSLTVAGTSTTSALIQGETGTGKGLVANIIHFFSSRKDFPFIKLNCSSVPDALLETEMFGYEKGAFTDAKQTKKGLFEIADGGTVFLDEIGDMDIRLQPKLLHFLENRTFRRVGGVRDIKVDVRIIAATNKDLDTMVREKRFREDLYYRLKVMVINIPSLRERKDDIMPLAEHFMEENEKNLKKGVKGLSAEAKDILLKYPWPGNVRELKNVIERAMILANSDMIQPDNLPQELLEGAGSFYIQTKASPDNMTLEEIERAHILNVFEKVKGNKTHASKILGISRLTLREKLRKYGIEPQPG